MKKIILGFSVVVGLMTLAFSANHDNSGQNRGYYKSSKASGFHRGFRQHKGGIFHLVYQLDLTNEQIDKIDAIKKEHKMSKKELRSKMREARKNTSTKNSILSDASKYMSADSFNKGIFTQLANEKAKEKYEQRTQSMKERRASKISKMADNLEKIFAILNTTQRVKLIELATK